MSQQVFRTILFTFTLLMTWSCTTDFDLSGEYKETAIIYGLLDPAASTQYIKITKGYFNENKSAIESMQEYDSVYYDTTLLIVELEELNENGTTLRTIKMNPTTDFPKEEGDFNATDINHKHILYYTDETIYSDYTYHLTVTNSQTGYEATSITKIVEKSGKIGSDDLVLLTNPYPIEEVKVHFEWEGDHSISWKEPKNATEYQCMIKIYYSEENVAQEVISYQLFSRVKKLIYTGSGNAFYNTLANTLENTSDDRSIDSIGLQFTYVGESLTNYIDITSAQTGLIQSQIVPEYSNIENGIGLFSSKTSFEYTFTELSLGTKVNLKCGEITSELGFNYPDNIVPCN